MYPKEFRRDVAALVIDQHRTAADVARELGLVAQTLGIWVHKDRHSASPTLAGHPGQANVVVRHRAECPSLSHMCRSITTLRGLDPAATDEEIEDAARQYVRKVSGIRAPAAPTQAAFDEAVEKVASATAGLLAQLPPRRVPPPTVPPRRRLATAGRSAAG